MFTAMLITLACNEDNYIDEWIAYHLKVGFSKIVVGLNNWEYPSFGKYREDDRVVFSHFDGIWNPHFIQAKFYTDVKDGIGKSYDFVGAWDVDEFLVVSNSFQTFLSSIVENPSTLIHWRTFGDNGLVSEPDDGDYSVLKRFTRCAKSPEKNGKSIVSNLSDGKYLQWWNPHFTSMKATNVIVRFSTVNAELYHYRNKTIVERNQRDGLKFENGDLVYNPEGALGKSLFERYNKNEVENTKAKDFLYGE